MIEQTVETALGSIAIRKAGRGLPIVCLHATGHGGCDFDRLGERLGDRYSFISLDWPGHGKSPRTSVAASAVYYTDVLSAVIDTLDLECFVLLGNSIGGSAAIQYAARFPHRVSGLVLCNSGGLVAVNWIVRLFCRRMARRFARGAAGDPSFPQWFDRYYRTVLSEPAAFWRRQEIIDSQVRIAPILAEAWDSFARPEADIRHHMRDLPMPVLYAWAKSDRVIRWSWVRKAAVTAPRHEVALLEGSHAAFLEQPDVFDAVLIRFIEQQLASADPGVAASIATV